MPRVSVITPAHNSADTIGGAIASVVGQTFADWEMIVADDASGDGTAAAARAYGDSRVSVHSSPRNLGPGGARNLALRHAQGELVALLDADDRWLPSYLERMVARHDAEPGAVGIVACDAYLVADGVRQGRTYYAGLPDPEMLGLDRMLRGNAIFVSALVPRAVGQELGWFSTELFGTEDYDLWLRILESGRRAVLLAEPLAEYRVQPGSVSSNLPRMARSYQLTYQRALQRGALTAAQRRIAEREIRYCRALELVAEGWTGREQPLAARMKALAPHAGLLAGVVAANPRRWPEWLRTLRRLR